MFALCPGENVTLFMANFNKFLSEEKEMLSETKEKELKSSNVSLTLLTPPSPPSH
jgi:hypothetical protein